jgi:hypothetical protein
MQEWNPFYIKQITLDVQFKIGLPMEFVHEKFTKTIFVVATKCTYLVWWRVPE